METQEHFWIEEKQADSFALRYLAEKRLHTGQSDYQRVEMVQTKSFGKMLLNDGLVMVSERDEFVYHEMIAHVPLNVHPDPQKVLIIGGGDGGSAREVLRHPGVSTCVMVEIDNMVVDVCRRHLPVCASSLDDPKLELIIGDGVRFVQETKDIFDVVLVDSTDPIGPATPLFGSDFYRQVHEILSPGGIVVSQGGSPWYESETMTKLLQIKREFFPITTCYNYHNLTYPGGMWTFTWGSKGPHPLRDISPRPLAGSLRYYTPQVHRAAFALPQFQLEQVAKHCRGLA